MMTEYDLWKRLDPALPWFGQRMVLEDTVWPVATFSIKYVSWRVAPEPKACFWPPPPQKRRPRKPVVGDKADKAHGHKPAPKPDDSDISSLSGVESGDGGGEGGGLGLTRLRLTASLNASRRSPNASAIRC